MKNKIFNKELLNSRFYILDSGRRGFTLIEVLVVVAITSFLAGMVLTYSSKGRSQVALYVEAAKISQVILRAKSLAVATFNNPDVPCGYGVHVDYIQKTYSLFSYGVAGSCNTIDDGPVDTDPNGSQKYLAKVADTFSLSPGLNYIDEGAESLGDILFIPPDPQTLIWGHGNGAPGANSSAIGLSSAADPTSRIQIRVSSAGQITQGTF